METFHFYYFLNRTVLHVFTKRLYPVGEYKSSRNNCRAARFIYLHYFTSLFCVRELGIHRETGTWHRDTGTGPSPFPISSFFFSNKSAPLSLTPLQRSLRSSPMKSQCLNTVVATTLQPLLLLPYSLANPICFPIWKHLLGFFPLYF